MTLEQFLVVLVLIIFLIIGISVAVHESKKEKEEERAKRAAEESRCPHCGGATVCDCASCGTPMYNFPNHRDKGVCTVCHGRGRI